MLYKSIPCVTHTINDQITFFNSPCRIALDILDILLLRMISFNFLIVFMSGNHADMGSEMMVLSKGWFISSYITPMMSDAGSFTNN